MTLAVAYCHPEIPVVSCIGARCYFDRKSAPEVLTKEDADEQAQILVDAMALKERAMDVMHPEKRVVTSDSSACGRNYFLRYGAEEKEDIEEVEERRRVLAEAAALKNTAVDYMQPEVGVVTSDPMACGRNFYSGYGTEDEEDDDEAEERARVLAEAAA